MHRLLSNIITHDGHTSATIGQKFLLWWIPEGKCTLAIHRLPDYMNVPRAAQAAHANVLLPYAATLEAHKLRDFGAEGAAQDIANAHRSGLPEGTHTAPEWSGLTAMQLQRLAKSPMALRVAKQSLAGHIAGTKAVVSGVVVGALLCLGPGQAQMRIL